MADTGNWAFPAEVQPNPEELAYDLSTALDAMVQVHAEIPEDAFTASILGTERLGNGVVIRDDGLVLTIGYLITEASTIWLTTNNGQVVQGHPLAYDQATGFGLIYPLGRMNATHLEIGTSSACALGEDVIVAGHGGRAHSLKATVIAKREFAGYWEYVLDEAIFTAPAHPHWGGAALVGDDGKLAGIGSLLVEEKFRQETVKGNMFVPIDLLTPILDAMVRTGRSGLPPRPWLGLYATEVEGHLVVAGLADGAPAERAGVALHDLVLEVNGAPVGSLADFLRKVWALGAAGIDVPLTLGRKREVVKLSIASADRQSFLKRPSLH